VANRIKLRDPSIHTIEEWRRWKSVALSTADNATSAKAELSLKLLSKTTESTNVLARLHKDYYISLAEEMYQATYEFTVAEQLITPAKSDQGAASAGWCEKNTVHKAPMQVRIQTFKH